MNKIRKYLGLPVFELFVLAILLFGIAIAIWRTFPVAENFDQQVVEEEPNPRTGSGAVDN